MLNHKHPTRGAGKAGQRGASMIELLVSILIFAFGMLGLVGLQTRTLSYGQFSLYRSQATALSDDILDRMRTDRVSAKAGGWDSALSVAAASIGTSTFAEADLKDWKQQVEGLLPLGKGQVAVAAGVVTITMTWDERGTTQSFVTTSGL
jgi:type IV pilus assembly protein PilV